MVLLQRYKVMDEINRADAFLEWDVRHAEAEETVGHRKLLRELMVRI